MKSPVDVAFVEIHRVRGEADRVSWLDGKAHRVDDAGALLGPLSVGVTIRVGETIVLEPGARAVVSGREIVGGRRGRAHAFVAEDAFRSNPSRADVPKLLDQLRQIERQMERLGEDPLAMQRGPESDYERAVAHEFVRANLTREAALLLDEAVAREVRAVCLFLCEDSAYLATSSLSIAKVRTIMEALGRPVNPHLVDDEVIDELLERVYDPGARLDHRS